MQRLIKDFLARYWWAILIGMAYSMMSLPNGSFFLGGVLVLGPVLISWERMRGAFTVYGTLPVSYKTLARTLWLEGAILVPLIYLVWCPAMNLLASVFTSAPLFTGQNAPISILLTTVVGMGYASVMMLLLPSFPRSGGTGAAWLLRSIAAGGFWGLLCGGMFLVPIVLKTGLERHEPWYFAALAATPIAVALSYARSARILTSVRVQATSAVYARPSYSRSRLRFWFQFWVPQVLMILSLLLLSATISIVMALLRHEGKPFEMMLGGLTFFMVLIATMFSAVWFNSLRSLRALPMTPARLTLFLLAIPAATVAIATVFVTVLCMGSGAPGMVWQCLRAASVALGFGFAGCIAITRFGQKAMVPVVMALMLSSMVFSLRPQRLALFSLIVSIAMYVVLKMLIKSSSEVYHQKPFGRYPR